MTDLSRTAETPTASTVHEPLGRPGGPGLWKHKTWQLPAYIQHVAHDLIESGHPESQAIGMAVGIVKNWAAGHDGKGNKVHSDVQAAAAKNIAQWEAMKARTAHGARRMDIGRAFNPREARDPHSGKWVFAGAGEGASKADLADQASDNTFRRGDSTAEAVTGHGEAAKAHRAAARDSGTSSGYDYHTKMAALHAKVARGTLASRDAEDQADALRGRTFTKVKARRATVTDTYDSDGLDASWDGDHADLPDLTGLTVADFAGDDDLGEVSRAAKLGTGTRFANLKKSLAAKGASDPGALAAFIGRKKFGKKRFHALASAARKRKSGPAVASRAGELVRFYPLEECRLLDRSDGSEYASGRTVEAYAAIWDTPAKITDGEGRYIETIERTAFDQILGEIAPERNHGFWRVTCLFNHGMTVHGTPAERFSLPAGVTRHITPEGRGLLTRTEYAATPLGEELLELVNLGALRTQSFTGDIIRSDPQLRFPGDTYNRGPGGVLQRVRRIILGLREYGLTPFAAYTGAEVLGVRMQLPSGPEEGDYWENDGDPDEGFTEPIDGGSEPPDSEGTVERSTGNRLWRLRTEELLAQHGIRLGD